MNVIAFLLGSKLGRKIAVGLLFCGTVALILWRVFMAGRNAAVIDEKLDQLQAIKHKVEIDNEIARLPADKRRERLRRWVRDNKR